MNYAYPLHTDIPNLASGTGLDLLNCLLLIRYQCAAAAMEQPCQGAAEGHAREDLWHKIAAAAEREDGRILPVIRAAMGRIKPELPFMPELFRRPNGLGVVDERAWRLLIRQLDSLPIADLLPSDDRSAPKEDVLPNCWKWNLAKAYTTPTVEAAPCCTARRSPTPANSCSCMVKPLIPSLFSSPR